MEERRYNVNYYVRMGEFGIRRYLIVFSRLLIERSVSMNAPAYSPEATRFIFQMWTSLVRALSWRSDFAGWRRTREHVERDKSGN